MVSSLAKSLGFPGGPKVLAAIKFWIATISAFPDRKSWVILGNQGVAKVNFNSESVSKEPQDSVAKFKIVLYGMFWNSTFLPVNPFLSIYKMAVGKKVNQMNYLWQNVNKQKNSLPRNKRFLLKFLSLQNLLYFDNKKTHVVFFVFHFVQLYNFYLWMPWSMT